MLVFIWFGIYGIFFYHETEIREYTPNWTERPVESNSSQMSLEITPELISFIVSEIGAHKLRRNPINLKKPVINFLISDLEYYSVIDKEIDSFVGNSPGADISISISRDILERAVSSDSFEDVIKEEALNGNIELKKISSDQELFLKGYWNLYKDLSS